MTEGLRGSGKEGLCIGGTCNYQLGWCPAASEQPAAQLSFTGSTEVGRSLMRQASDNLLPLSMELVGNAPSWFRTRLGFQHRGGPLIDDKQRSGLHSMIQEALGCGATPAIGGAPALEQGYFHASTVLTNVPADAAILKREILGPVAPLAIFDTEEGGHRFGERLGVRAGGLPLHRATESDATDR